MDPKRLLVVGAVDALVLGQPRPVGPPEGLCPPAAGLGRVVDAHGGGGERGVQHGDVGGHGEGGIQAILTKIFAPKKISRLAPSIARDFFKVCLQKIIKSRVLPVFSTTFTLSLFFTLTHSHFLECLFVPAETQRRLKKRNGPRIRFLPLSLSIFSLLVLQ